MRNTTLKSRRALTVAIVLGGAAILGSLVPTIFPGPSVATDPDGLSISGCRVTDGDTVRCGDERIRLLGIDAPELPGHCRTGRHCAPGDPYASTDNLKAALKAPLTITRFGTDHYDRTLAMMSGAKGDLSCWQLRHDQAIYKPQWDDGGRVAAVCPNAARQ